MKNTAQNTIRRSIALPNKLVEELRAVAPPDLRDNFNRLVTFETAMAEMANDPAIREVCSVDHPAQ